MKLRKKSYVFIFLLVILLCVIFFTTYIQSSWFLLEENFDNEYPNLNIEIVIARYNETLDWIDQEPFNKYPITIYNKGPNDNFKQISNVKRIIPVENVGRCDHTYLYHVIKNYDNLADITISLPGSSDIDYKINTAKNTVIETEKNKNSHFNDYTESVYNEFKDFQLDEWSATHNANKTINSETKLTLSKIRPFGQWYKAHFGDRVTKKFAWMGFFSVHKKHILQHPLEYYQELIRELEVSSNPEVGHYYERAWGAVFGPLD